MKSYTLHLPAEARPGDAGALESAVVVKDAFSWGAFLFTALWFFFHRLWIAGFGVLLAVVGLAVGLRLLNVSPGATFLAEALLAALIGLEASSLRRWTLSRRGRPAVDVVAASDLAEAETKSFGRWLAGSKAEPPARATPTPLYRGPEPVIGLFPEAERRT